MTDLTWLIGQRFQSFTWREFDWVLTFDKQGQLVIECLWRLLENGRIRFTSMDHGHQFGLPAPVDAALEVANRLTGSLVESVELREAILDLELRFSTGHILQVIPDSAGYEAWNLSDGSSQFIACGGGNLAIFGHPNR
jgi:hypothetical protein